MWACNYIHSVTSLHALEFPYVSVVTPAIHHNCSLGKTAVLASGIFTAHQPIKLHLILFQSSLRLQREVQNGLWPALWGNSGAELLSSAVAVQCDSSRVAAFWGRWKSVGVRGSQWHLRILDWNQIFFVSFRLCMRKWQKREGQQKCETSLVLRFGSHGKGIKQTSIFFFRFLFFSRTLSFCSKMQWAALLSAVYICRCLS